MRPVVLATCSVMAAGCVSSSGPDAGPSPYHFDDVLRLDQAQAKGTHNSYHVASEHPVVPSHAYTQAPLDVQLSQQGVRQIELDLHYRAGLGFLVFHIPVLDEKTTCGKLVECLQTMKAWSDAHPWHFPIMLWLEPKDGDDAIIDPRLLSLNGRFEELEAVLLSVWPRERIFAPDDLRRGYPDLPSAVRDAGWPTLGRMRGKLIISLLDSGAHRAEYTRDGGNLAGRLMFVASTDPSDAFAAVFKVDDPVGNATDVTRWVREGFVITGTVDEAGQDAGANFATLQAALAAGVNFGSSDFPAPVMGYDYWFELDGGAPVRCNPIATDARCAPEELENLR